MARVAVVYHSGFGHTKVVAEAVAQGARAVAGTEVDLIPVAELPAPGPDKKYAERWRALEQADAIIFGAPTYMGDVSAEFKKFAEASSTIWYKRLWKDKLAGGFVNSGSPAGDKLHALSSLAILAAQHGMLWVPVVEATNSTADGVEGVNKVGTWLGVATHSEQRAPTETPGAGERKGAELYGKRVAELAARWSRGLAT